MQEPPWPLPHTPELQLHRLGAFSERRRPSSVRPALRQECGPLLVAGSSSPSASQAPDSTCSRLNRLSLLPASTHQGQVPGHLTLLCVPPRGLSFLRDVCPASNTQGPGSPFLLSLHPSDHQLRQHLKQGKRRRGVHCAGNPTHWPRSLELPVTRVTVVTVLSPAGIALTITTRKHS